MTDAAVGTARMARAQPNRIGENGVLRILGYHRITEPERTPGLEPALISATPAVFRRQMLHLARRYQVVSLEDVLTAFRGGEPLPDRAVLLTFDDAYRDFKEEAWPILRDLELPATLFVPTAYPGRPDRSFWWDRLHRILQEGGEDASDGRGSGLADGLVSMSEDLAAGVSDLRRFLKRLTQEEVEDVLDDLARTRPLHPEAEAPRPAVLDWDEIRGLVADGVSVGAHTVWHPALTRTPDARIRSELRDSLEDLREQVGEDVPAVISYPYGFHDDRVLRVAEDEGFELGITCLDGLNRVGETDPLRLHRTVVTRRTTPLIFRLRMLPWFVAVDRWRHRAEESRATGAPVSSANVLRSPLEAVRARLRSALGPLPWGAP